MEPADRLTCFGDGSITFTAFVSYSPGEGVGPPPWLTNDAPFWVFPKDPSISQIVGVIAMDAYRDPKLSNPLPQDSPGEWFIVAGHFNDPRATRCAPFADETRDQAVTRCRRSFVMTSAVPTKAP
jgi:hypothetical protein